MYPDGFQQKLNSCTQKTTYTQEKNKQKKALARVASIIKYVCKCNNWTWIGGRGTARGRKASPCLRSVSYTHLDVYKRQYFSTSSSNNPHLNQK